MTISITINLPKNLVESAQRLGDATARKLSDVLVDTLEIVLPTFENLSEMSINSEILHVSDQEVLELANLKMDAAQNERLGELQVKWSFQYCWRGLKQFAIRNDARGLATATLTQLRFVTGI